MHLSKSIPQNVLNRKSVFESFYKKMPSGCWEWQKSKRHHGYGQFMSHAAHRVSYALYIGDTAGYLICHKCDNPPCVNPDHLFAGTHQQNMDDMRNKGRAKNNLKGLDANYCNMTKQKLDEMINYYNSNVVSVRHVARTFKMESKHCWFWLKKCGCNIRNKKKRKSKRKKQEQ